MGAVGQSIPNALKVRCPPSMDYQPWHRPMVFHQLLSWMAQRSKPWESSKESLGQPWSFASNGQNHIHPGRMQPAEGAIWELKCGWCGQKMMQAWSPHKLAMGPLPGTGGTDLVKYHPWPLGSKRASTWARQSSWHLPFCTIAMVSMDKAVWHCLSFPFREPKYSRLHNNSKYLALSLTL